MIYMSCVCLAFLLVFDFSRVFQWWVLWSSNAEVKVVSTVDGDQLWLKTFQLLWKMFVSSNKRPQETRKNEENMEKPSTIKPPKNGKTMAKQETL